MSIDFLRERFAEARDETALVWRSREVSYGELLSVVDRWREELASRGVAPGAVVSLEADFSPNAVALLLALVERGCVLVPLTSSVDAVKSAPMVA